MSFVTQLGSKQYLVDYNYQFVVDNLNLQVDETIELPVLFSLDKSFTKKTVTAKVKANKMGEKLRVVRFHNKTTYHKVKGFRARQTVLEILETAKKEAPTKQVEATTAVEATTEKVAKAPTKTPKPKAVKKADKSEK